MDRILPYILATLTQHNRQKVVAGVDFEWSSNNWTHNVFRVYELLFWRREGIRIEALTAREITPDGSIRHIKEFYTWEAAIAHFEGVIRALPRIIYEWTPPIKVQIYIPTLITPQGFPIPASPYLFAIAFDTATFIDGPGSASSVSDTHTATGSNRLAVMIARAGATSGSTTTVSSYTYDGVAFTAQVQSNTALSAGEGMWFYYKTAPTTTTNASVVFTVNNASNTLNLKTVTYTGVAQTGTLDNSTRNTVATVTTFTMTLTPVVSNTWFMMCVRSDNAMTDSTHCTTRTGAVYLEADSNGAAMSAGVSFSMSQTCSSGKVCGIAATFAPFVATINSQFLAFM